MTEARSKNNKECQTKAPENNEQGVGLGEKEWTGEQRNPGGLSGLPQCYNQ